MFNEFGVVKRNELYSHIIRYNCNIQPANVSWRYGLGYNRGLTTMDTPGSQWETRCFSWSLFTSVFFVVQGLLYLQVFDGYIMGNSTAHDWTFSFHVFMSNFMEDNGHVTEVKWVVQQSEIMEISWISTESQRFNEFNGYIMGCHWNFASNMVEPIEASSIMGISVGGVTNMTMVRY